MDIADKNRVAKLLGMLGSTFAGERENAIGMLKKLADKHKLSLNELISQAHNAPAQAAHQSPPPPQRPKRAAGNNGFRKVREADRANENLCKLDLLWEIEEGNDFPLFTEWERQFISDVTGRYEQDYELSDKQLNIVFRILQKAERAGVKWHE